MYFGKREKYLWTFLAVLVLAAVLVWAAVFSQNTETLKVSFLDVGQGDAIFIESPTGVQVLVDGGPHRSVLRPLGKEMRFFDRSIDAVFYTHPDSDHIGGLPEVLERYKVSVFGETGAVSETALFGALERRRDVEGAEILNLKRGQVFGIGGGAQIEVLFPDREVSSADSNLSSVILRLSYGQTDFLLTGDAPKASEEYITGLDGGELGSEVLKLSHHGSKTSSASAFLSAVSPEYAIVSAECDSRYGHPHEEVLERVRSVEAEILSTCEHGTITFESDGDNLLLLD